MRTRAPTADGAAEPLRPAGGPPRPRVWPVLVAWCGLAAGAGAARRPVQPAVEGRVPRPRPPAAPRRAARLVPVRRRLVRGHRHPGLLPGRRPEPGRLLPRLPAGRCAGWGRLFGGNVPLTAIAVTFACGAGAVGLFTLWVRDRLDPARGPLGGRPAACSTPTAGTSSGPSTPTPSSCCSHWPRSSRWNGTIRCWPACSARWPPRPARSARPWWSAWRCWRSNGGARCARCREVAPAGAGRLRRVAHHLRLPCGIEWRRLHPADAGVLLSALGFVAYSGWLWWRFGDPFAFSTVQQYWDQPTGPVTWVKAHLWGNVVLHFPSKARYLLGCLLQGALTIGAHALRAPHRPPPGLGLRAAGADRHGPAGAGQQGLPGHGPLPAGGLPGLRGGGRVAVRPLAARPGRGASRPAPRCCCSGPTSTPAASTSPDRRGCATGLAVRSWRSTASSPGPPGGERPSRPAYLPYLSSAARQGWSKRG